MITTRGAEAMGLVDERAILVADAPEVMAEAVVRLYTDGALCNGNTIRSRVA